MNQELSETIDIIARQLLRDPEFCGSLEGRRLRDLLWEMIGKYHPRPIRVTEPNVRPMTTRTLVLPTQLDNAVTVIVEKSGLSRDDLISNALALLLAENRLA
jgi:hypothetical protein